MAPPEQQRTGRELQMRQPQRRRRRLLRCFRRSIFCCHGPSVDSALHAIRGSSVTVSIASFVVVFPLPLALLLLLLLLLLPLLLLARSIVVASSSAVAANCPSPLCEKAPKTFQCIV